MATFYLDRTTFGAATAVYTDIGLTTKAPDQWYSDGIIARQQVSGVLGAAQNCSCNLIQNILVRDLKLKNSTGASFTLTAAKISTASGVGGVEDNISSGSVTVLNNGTYSFASGDLVLEGANLLGTGDKLYLQLTMSTDIRGSGYDFTSLARPSAPPFSTNMNQSEITNSETFIGGVYNVVLPIEVTSTPPNNFAGYVTGDITVNTL